MIRTGVQMSDEFQSVSERCLDNVLVFNSCLDIVMEP